jgi:hypothetical protein
MERYKNLVIKDTKDTMERLMGSGLGGRERTGISGQKVHCHTKGQGVQKQVQSC